MDEDTGIKLIAAIGLVLVLGFFWNQINVWFSQFMTLQTNVGVLGVLALIGVFAYLGVRRRLK